MPKHDIFISHATADDEFVAKLREKLKLHRFSTWVDSRDLRGGDILYQTIKSAIEEASYFIVVLSPHTFNSLAVQKEVKYAEEVRERLGENNYRIIPLLLSGVEPAALPLWFDQIPIARKVALRVNGLYEAFPAILVALGKQLPTDPENPILVERKPIAELRLELTRPSLKMIEDKPRARAEALLIYTRSGQQEQRSSPFLFASPLGVIEKEDLSWYLERYITWPVGFYQKKAKAIEDKFSIWGTELYKEATKTESAKIVFRNWEDSAESSERRFSIYVDEKLLEGSKEEEVKEAKEATTLLLGLPWELLHDGEAHLFQDGHAAGICRRLPYRKKAQTRLLELPVRILLISPRPEEGASYIDHRASALPMVEAAESLGELIKIDILHTPTLPALRAFLKKAREEHNPVDVLHFDGHGVYDPHHGLGALCFESPQDQSKLGKRRTALVYADELGGLLRDYHIPLVFLDACQTAQTEKDPTASVAAKLLEMGVGSVVAMSHSVLVETSRRFVNAFYKALATGKRIGEAMLEGQLHLYGDSHRGKVIGSREFHLKDWFVPVLYQEQHDPQLFAEIPSRGAQAVQSAELHKRMEKLPKPPSHTFVGRSRELLSLERILQHQPYALIRGIGGAGKTTLAVELTRWWIRSKRTSRAVFVSLENCYEVRQMLDTVGQQILPKYSVAEYGEDLQAAFLPIERALRDTSTIIVCDNMESVLPDSEGKSLIATAESWQNLQTCFTQLLQASPHTRLIFTSREPLLAPFDRGASSLFLDFLSPGDALILLSQVMTNEGWNPPLDDEGREEDLKQLAQKVNYHARALVLLAREIGRKGVKATGVDIGELMEDLERRYPGDRENSLFGSLVLSLRRLSAAEQGLLPALSVCHGGNHWTVWAEMVGGKKEKRTQIQALVARLEEVGLATERNYGYVQLDLALPIWLKRQMQISHFASWQNKWLEAMQSYTQYLYQQRFQDTCISSYLLQLELPNLLVMFELGKKRFNPETFIDLAGRVESLLRPFHLPQVKKQVVAWREELVKDLSGWNKAFYSHLNDEVERLLTQGRMQEAYELSLEILTNALREGEEAYSEADYHIAYAHWQLGRVLQKKGSAQAALEPLIEAYERFGSMNEKYSEATRMASLSLMEMADCYNYLGQYEQATIYYEERIIFAEKAGDWRGLAVAKSQLGTLRLRQQDYLAALSAYKTAMKVFEEMGETVSVAVAWHQIGMVYHELQQYIKAEEAYRKSLKLKVQMGNQLGEAGSLVQLGLLYKDQGRAEEAIVFYKQGAALSTRMGHRVMEATARSNLANVLILLKQYKEARKEIQRAIECGEGLGHAINRWKEYIILHDLEIVSGHEVAAAIAREKAGTLYLSYRRDGGESQSRSGEWCEQVLAGMKEGHIAGLQAGLEQLMKDEGLYASEKKLVLKLQAILEGSRDVALAEDERLEFDQTAELRLLLKRLNG